MNKKQFALIFSVSIPLVLGSSQEISGDIEVAYIPFSPGVTLQLSGLSVGGEYITLDTTALLASGVQTNLSWIVPIALSVVGIGVILVRKKF